MTPPQPTQVAAKLATWVVKRPASLNCYALLLPDTRAALALLWLDLGRAGPPRPWAEAGTGFDPRTEEEAHHLLLLLVQIDGWQRLKRCNHVKCQRVLIDASNPVNRKRCDLHSRH